MNKTRIIPWLLVGALTLSACGGGTSANSSDPVEASASQAPAQSVMAPLPFAPEPAPAVSAPAPDVSQPDSSSAPSSQEEGDASQAPDANQAPEAPPAVTKPPKVTTTSPKVTKPKPEPQQPDSSGDICGLPPAPSEDQSAAETEPKAAPTKADAQAYIGKSASSLIAAIGAPKGSDYAPSCLGDGEDGELFYDGFTVYTYRLNGTETVQDVV